MKKEGIDGFFNSNNGKVNIMLLFSIMLIFMLIFVLSIAYVEAINIRLISPGNFTFNGTASRNINFTFNVTWSADVENASNCTLWVNSTSSGIGWNGWNKWKTVDIAKNGTALQPDDRIFNATGSDTNFSYMNLTINNTYGNFTWSVGCYTNNASGTLAFPNSTDSFGVKTNTNFTFVLDTVPPTLVAITPNTTLKDGIVWGDGGTGNFTGWPIRFRVNVSDNTTTTAYYILNATITTTPGVGLENTTPVSGLTRNTTMSREFNGSKFGDTIISDGFAHNVSLNFSSSWRGPGAHSVVFCANDSAGNRRCIGSYDFLMVGINVTQMESVLTGFGQAGSVTLNITFGNGTEIPAGDEDPLPSSSYVNPLTQNMTFIFNFGSGKRVHMVGMTVDEVLLGNASNANITESPELIMRQSVGTGYNTTLAGGDFAKFIPDFIRYKFGVVEVQGIGFNRHLYCTGASISSPNCTTINVCNATAFGVNNDSNVLNTIIGASSSTTASACYLEGGQGQLYNVTLTADKTYIFMQHFSSGIGGNDTNVPQFNFTAPVTDIKQILNVSTAAERLINFTVLDTNGTGINLTRNNTINLSIQLGGTLVKFYNYTNQSDITKLTCTTADATSPANSTLVTCNATFNFNSNGTYSVIAGAQDASNNTNFNSTTITLIVDQIPPVFYYYNFTNTSTFNISANATGDGSNSAFQLGITAGTSRAQGDSKSGTIYAVANWTDNLTTPFQALLQFYNVTNSGGTWQTLNITNTTVGAGSVLYINQSGFSNFSFPIPTGRNEFEGKNVSFRIIANDTLGNINSSNSVKNFTIQINDTTKPTLLISSIAGQGAVNGTNITDTTPTIVFNVTDNSSLTHIALQIDSSTSFTCNLKANFSSPAEANAHKNGSLTIKGPDDDAACSALTNGTHTVRLSVVDSWNNAEEYLHSFIVQTGEDMNISLGIVNTTQGPLTTDIINTSNITPYHQLSFNVTLQGAEQHLKNMTFVSSCNSAVTTISNASVTYPFNFSGCRNTEANQTVTVTAIDHTGNSITTMFRFLVDDLGPVVTVQSPLEGASFTNLALLNISAFDSSSLISSIGYYLDDNPAIQNHTLFNGSVYLTYGIGQNVTVNRTINFTPGTHTIKVSVNDTLGNVRNSSLITLTQTGNVLFSEVASTMSNYSVAVFNDVAFVNASVRIKTGIGTYNHITDTNESSTNTFEILFNMNGSINVSLTEINGSAVNWDKINFTPYINQSTTNGSAAFMRGLEANWTTRITRSVWFNNSLEQFITKNNSYYGVVVFPINNTHTANGTEFWWIVDERVLSSRQNITQCTTGFSVTTPSPCWNYTRGGRTIIQVPHFSIVVAVNDSNAPTINVTTPLANQTVSTFVPNITVSNDADICQYRVNSTGSVITMTKTGTICIGQSGSFTNLETVIGYNFTFNVTDNNGNSNTYIWNFNVSDNVAPNNGIISSTTGSTTATVTVTGANESVNVTVNYGTSNTSLGSSKTNTAFAATESVSITGLTASTTYHYNVTICDFNGNCKTNSTIFSFTTSAAAAAEAAAAAAAGGGGGGGAAAPSNEVATAARKWDSLAAGSSAVLTVSSADIAVTGVVVDVKNAVTNAEIKVASLASNPLSTAAAAKVYQYLQLTRSNIADADTSKIAVNFRVPKSWLTSNNIGEDGVVLYRYSDSKWNALPTSKTGTDANNVLYQSTTPGFSTFAIGGKEAAPLVAPAEEKPTEAPAPTAEVPAVPEEKPTMKEEAKKPALSRTAIAWIVVVIIVVVAAVGYYMWQKKKEE